MREVQFLKIKYNPPSKSYAVLLSVLNSKDVTAIPVGSKAANTISMAHDLGNNSFPRTFTHDLLLDIINNLNWKIILNNQQNSNLEIDCRPSDAITIAIKSDARIFIEDHVIERLEKSDFDVLTYTNSDDLSNNFNHELIENLYSALEKAVDNEEYEEAAKIRDRIKQIDKKIEK